LPVSLAGLLVLVPWPSRLAVLNWIVATLDQTLLIARPGIPTGF
jgi:uncharacterized membrane protein